MESTPTTPTPLASEKELRSLRKSLLGSMLRTVLAYDLIEKGDRILVAISGGKDSYTMLDLLERARAKSPVPFEIFALHVDQAQPGYDGTKLASWLSEREIPHEILREDTYSVVMEKTVPGATYCSLCSRLRRGILYTAASRHECNKVALGHHREDTLETLLLNLFYSGRLQAMPPRYTSNDGRHEIIRPLIETAEDDIENYAKKVGYPIIPCNLCGSQDNLKRVQVGRLLTRLEKEIPNLRTVMMSALKNVRPSHLLDGEVAKAWGTQEHLYPRRQ